MPKVLCYLMFFLLLFFQTGCWDARNIDRMTFPVVIGVDNPKALKEEEKKEKKDKAPEQGEEKDTGRQHVYTYSLPVLSEDSPEKKEVLSTYGRDIADSLFTLQSRVNRNISIGQLMDIVFDETEAKQGIMKHLRGLIPNPEIPGNAFLLISKGQSARKLLTTKVPEIGVGVYLTSLRESVEWFNFIPFTSLDTFLIDIFNVSANSVIPTFSVYKAEDKKLENIGFSGLAIMKKDKMVGTLSRNDSQTLAIMRYSGIRQIISLPQKSGNIAGLFNTTVKVIPFYSKGKFSFLIKVAMKGELLEKPLSRNLLSNHTIVELLENRIGDKVEKDCKRVIEKLQKDYKTDVLYLNKAAYIKYPKQYDAEKWEKDFPEAKIKVQVKVHFRKIGVTL